MKSSIPSIAWGSALVIFGLFLIILAGVSVWREALAQPLAGGITVGSALLIALHLAPVIMGVVYLRSTRPGERHENVHRDAGGDV